MFKIKVKDELKYLKLDDLDKYVFKVIFTTRVGGNSPPYKSLNMGLHTVNKKLQKNREKVYNILNLSPDDLIFAVQIHSNK